MVGRTAVALLAVLCLALSCSGCVSLEERQNAFVENVLVRTDPLIDKAEYRQAALVFEQALSSLPEERRLLYNWAYCLAASGDLSEAEVVLSRLVESYQRNVSYRMAYAASLDLQGKHSQARDQWFEVLALDPLAEDAGLLALESLFEDRLYDEAKTLADSMYGNGLFSAKLFLTLAELERALGVSDGATYEALAALHAK